MSNLLYPSYGNSLSAACGYLLYKTAALNTMSAFEWIPSEHREGSCHFLGLMTGCVALHREALARISCLSALHGNFLEYLCGNRKLNAANHAWLVLLQRRKAL